MLCDWLSLVYDVKTDQDRALVAHLGKDRDHGYIVTPDGVVKNEWYSRKKKRSDSHELTVGLSRNRITIDGSPARLGKDNNVFGDSNLRACAQRMVRHIGTASGVILPPVDRWRFTRIDATQNYDCGEYRLVRAALDSLQHVAGGRLKNHTFGETVYWNKSSDLWSAKAYAKGPHLLYQMKKRQAGASDAEYIAAQRLLRIEVSLKNQLIREMRLTWDNLTQEVLMDLFKERLEQIVPVGSCQVSSEQQFAQSLIQEFGRKKARSLCGTWGQIKMLGLAATQEGMPRATWFDHQKCFKQVGLSMGDIATASILPFRPKSITAQPVDSWDEIAKAA